MVDIPGSEAAGKAAETAGKGASKAGSLLTKNVGPLPAGAWIILVGGGLFFAYRINASKGDGSSDVTIKTEPTSNLVGSGPGAVGWNVITQAPTPPATSTDGDVSTNAEWYRKGYTYALTKNFAPALVDSALRKYLAANPLTASEQAVIDEIIKGIGPTPEPLSPTGQAVTPVNNVPDPKPAPPKPKPPAAGPRTYTVTKWNAAGSSLFTIAQHEYGNGNLWPKIYNANRSIIKDPNRIYPGMKLVIPA